MRRQRLRKNKGLEGADMSGLDLSEMKIAALNAEGINLSGANLTKSVIAALNLEGAKFIQGPDVRGKDRRGQPGKREFSRGAAAGGQH